MRNLFTPALTFTWSASLPLAALLASVEGGGDRRRGEDAGGEIEYGGLSVERRAVPLLADQRCQAGEAADDEVVAALAAHRAFMPQRHVLQVYHALV